MRRLAGAAVLVLWTAAALLARGGTAIAAGPSAQDRAFLQAAHQANLAELSAARLGLTRARSDELRRHAKLFVADHLRLDAEVRGLAKQLAVPLPA